MQDYLILLRQYRDMNILVELEVRQTKYQKIDNKRQRIVMLIYF